MVKQNGSLAKRWVGRLGAFVVLGLLSGLAQAGTIVVNTTVDEDNTHNNPPGSNSCSLREAIQSAFDDSNFGGCTGATTGANTIVFDMDVNDPGHVCYSSDGAGNNTFGPVMQVNSLDPASCDPDHPFSWFRFVLDRVPTRTLFVGADTTLDAYDVDVVGFGFTVATDIAKEATPTSRAVIRIEVDCSGQDGGNGLEDCFTAQAVSNVKVQGFSLHGAPSYNLQFLGDSAGTNHTGLEVYGNYIGVGPDGLVSRYDPNSENDQRGINIARMTGSKIGGTLGPNGQLLMGNLISGHGGSALDIGDLTRDSEVFGNYIGTDITGNTALPNDSHVPNSGTANGGQGGAVLFALLTANNVFGGPIANNTMVNGNLVSGNASNGIRTFNSASDNKFYGNFIGTNLSGDQALGNQFSGVNMTHGGGGALIGGAMNNKTLQLGNLISGNGENGIQLSFRIPGVRILGNFIGTDVTGTQDIGNGGSGVTMFRGAGDPAQSPMDVVIGEAMVNGEIGLGNLISGNGNSGIASFSESTGLVIRGNYVGTDINGTSAIGNNYAGIRINHAISPRIGGPLVGGKIASGNLVSGNSGPHPDGVRPFLSAIIISGLTSSPRIRGNFVGVDITGSNQIGNGGDPSVDLIGVSGAGIHITGNVTDALIGGSNDASAPDVMAPLLRGNLISGNHRNGVLVENNRNEDAAVESDRVTIQGNYIGSDLSGTNAIPNGGDGIGFSNQSNNFDGTFRNVQLLGTIGGDRANGEGNLIFAQGYSASAAVKGPDGIQLGADPVDTDVVAEVYGNFIGVDASGNGVGNNLYCGLRVKDTVDTIIGQAGAGFSNVIAGSGRSGICANNDSTDFAGDTTNDNLVIQNNIIGADADKSPASFATFGNGLHGIAIGNNATNVLIGGTSSSQSNFIVGSKTGTAADLSSHNGDGVYVYDTPDGTPTDVSILGNAIYQNQELGIDLNGGTGETSDGVTPNDGGDSDGGPNNRLNYPVFTDITISGSTATITYDLDVPASTNGYRVEFFYNASGADPSGYGEGQQFVSAEEPVTPGTGKTATITLPGGASDASRITATTTEIANSSGSSDSAKYGATSEFNEVLDVQQPEPFECDNDFYISANNPASGETNALFVLEHNVGSDTYGQPIELGALGTRVNALAFNPADNFMYGIDNGADDNATRTLVRIGTVRDGSNNITGLTVTPLTTTVDFSQSSYEFGPIAGTFDHQSNYYLIGDNASSSPTTPLVRVIHIDGDSATVPTNGPPATIDLGEATPDFAFNPVDQYIYYLSDSSGTPAVYYFDPYASNPQPVFVANVSDTATGGAANGINQQGEYFTLPAAGAGNFSLDQIAIGSFGNGTGQVTTLQSSTTHPSLRNYVDGAMCHGEVVDLNPDPFQCTNALYTLEPGTGGSRLEITDLTVDPSSRTLLATLNGAYNGLAYDHNSGFQYAVGGASGIEVIRISNDGTFASLGDAAGVQPLGVGSYATGAISPVDGHYYITAHNATASAGRFYRIDISGSTATLVNTVQIAQGYRFADIDFSPYNGDMYGFALGAGNADGTLARVDMTSVYSSNATGTLNVNGTTIGSATSDYVIGAAWFLGDNVFYGANGRNGQTYAVDLSDNSVTAVSIGPGNYTAADGAACFVPDLQKTVAPNPVAVGSTVTYTMQLINPTQNRLTGDVQDILADNRAYAAGTANFTATPTGAGATCGTATITTSNTNRDTITISGVNLPAVNIATETPASCTYTVSVDIPNNPALANTTVINQANMLNEQLLNTSNQPVVSIDVVSDYPVTPVKSDPTPLSITGQAPFECSAGFVEALNWAGAQPALMDINDTNFPSGTSSQSFTYSNADIGTRSYTVNASPGTGGYNPVVAIAGNSGNGNFFSFRDEAIPAGAPAGSNFDVEIVFNEPQDKITYSVSDLDGGWSNGNPAEVSNESQVIVGMLNGVVVTPVVVPRDATFMNVQNNPDGSVYVESTADMNLNNGDDNATFDVYFNSPIDSILIKHGPQRDESPIPDGAGGTIMAGISQCRDSVVVTANPVIATSKAIDTVYNGNNTSTSTVTIRVQNQGNVPLYDVQVVDPLTAFGSYVQAVTDVDTAGEYTVTNLSVTSDSGAFDNNANAAVFNGQNTIQDATTHLLTIETADEFAVGDEITITFDMTFYPDFTAAPFENQATAYGDEVPTGVNDRLNGNDPDQGAQDDSDDNTTPNDEDDPECSALQDPSGDPTADTPVDCNTPTPVVQTKAVKTVVDANGDGIAESGEVLTYTIVVTNISSADAVDLAFSDVLDSNTIYNNDASGTDDSGAIAFTFAGDTLTAALDLAAGNSTTITFGVTVKDRADISPADADVIGNQATVDGIPSCDVDPQAQPADCPRVSEIPLNPVVGAAKAVTSTPEDMNRIRTTVVIRAKNYGNTSLYDMQIEDRLATSAANPNGLGTFNADCAALVAGEYCVDTSNRSVDAPYTLNTTYNGDTDIELLVVDDGPELQVGESFSVTFDVIFYPDFEVTPYTNQAVVYGDTIVNRDGDSDKDAEDDSNDGTDPDPDDDDDPEEDDPTCETQPNPDPQICNDIPSVIPTPQAPVVGVAKNATIVESPDPSFPDGTFNVTYNFVIENFGNTRLYDMRLVDPLSTNNPLAASFAMPDGSFGTLDTDGTLAIGEYMIPAPPTITGGTALTSGNYIDTTADPAGNANFNGDTVIDLINIDQGFIAPGETITVQVVMTVRPDLDQAPFTNQAKGFGFLPENKDDPTNGDDTTTTGDADDDSNSGVDPDKNPNCEVDESCNDIETPVPFDSNPQIAVLKSVTSTVGPDANNVYTLIYDFSAENVGNVDLLGVQITDPLSDIFGEHVADPTATPLMQGQYHVDSISSPSGQANAGYDGGDANNGGDSTMLNADAVDLAPGESVRLTLTLLIYPDFANAPFENTAVGTGTDTSGNVATDLSDDVADVSQVPPECDPRQGGETDAPTCDIPTPLDIDPRPEIAVNKASEGVVDNGDGSFTATYRLYVQNVGDITLYDLNITDTLEGTNGLTDPNSPDQNFGAYSPTGLTAENQYLIPTGGLPVIENTTATEAPIVSSSYTGELTNNQMLNLSAGQGQLDPGQRFEVVYQVQFRPPANPVLNNQAKATADIVQDNTVGTDGDNIPSDEDDSDSGIDPESNPDCDPAQGGDPDADGCNDPTETPLARLGSSKQVIAIEKVTSGDDNGAFDITFQIDIANIGVVDLDNLTLVDDVASQVDTAIPPDVAFKGYIGNATITAAGNAVAPDPDNTPNDGPNFFDGISGLLPADDTSQITVVFTVRIDPSASTLANPLENSATVTGTDVDDPTNVAEDITDANESPRVTTDPDPDPDNCTDLVNDPTCTDDPLPILVNNIDAAKSVLNTVPAASGLPGNFDVTYQIVMRNTGAQILSPVNLIDDVQALDNLGASYVAVVEMPALNQLATTVATADMPTFDDAWPTNGGAVFAGTDGLMDLGEQIVFTFTVEIDPDADVANLPLTNQATATGLPPGGDPSNPDDYVTDLTDSGVDPQGPNPETPDNCTGVGTAPDCVDDPTDTPIGSINASKRVVEIENARTVNPTAQAGNFYVTYEIIVQNTGVLRIDGPTLVDDLGAADQLGNAYIGQIGDTVISTDAAETTTDNPPTASALPNLLNGTSGDLDVGERVTVTFTVEVDPDADGAPEELYNQATAGGTDENGEEVPEDETDSGTDPKTSNPEEDDNCIAEPDQDPLTCEDDPTSLVPPLAPEVGAVKAASDPVYNADGTITIDYALHAKNLGNIALGDVTLVDRLSATAGGDYGEFVDTISAPGQYLISSDPVITQNSADPLTVNAAYDGDAVINLFDVTQGGLLNAGETVIVEFSVTFYLDFANAPITNTAVVSGDISPDGIEPVDNDDGTFGDVSDVADDAQDPENPDPDPDGDEDPSEKVSDDPECIADPTADGCEDDPSISTFDPANLNGTVFLDENYNDILDGGEPVLGGWTVNVIDTFGNVVGTAVTDVNGEYEVNNLPPGTYDVQFMHPISGTMFANEDVTLPSNVTVNLPLPIDPSGVVYDAVTRVPVANATVTITDADGVPLPDVCVIDPSQQNQVTGPDGMYRFDVVPGADPVCPAETTEYLVRVNAPPGYQAGVSDLIPANPDTLDATGCTDSNGQVGTAADPCEVSPDATAPQTGDDTNYYLSFSLAPGDQNVVNNHIPLDPGTPIGAAKVVDEPTDNGNGTFTTTFTIYVENFAGVELGDVQIVDELSDEFGTFTNPLTAVGQYTVSGLRFVSNTAAPHELNTNYNGASDTTMLSASATARLAPEEVMIVAFELTFAPDFENAPFENTAIAGGDAGSSIDGIFTDNGDGTFGEFTDLSDAGSDPDPDGDGDPGEGDPNSLNCPSDLPESNCENDPTKLAPIPGTVILNKSVDKQEASIGDIVSYTITAENTTNDTLINIEIRDDLPGSFRMLDGSANLTQGGVNTPITGEGIDPISFIVTIGPKDTIEISYLVQVGAGVTSGNYTNLATPLSNDREIGNTASATVAVVQDPIFEQTTIIGKVFFDRDGDGYQDDGEDGIPGVRIATVEGLVIETDQYGRYHVAAVDGASFYRTRQFIAKVDENTLPSGSIMTTENPRVVPITQALMSRVNFGVQLPENLSYTDKLIRVKVRESVFFDNDKTDVKPEFQAMLMSLAEQIKATGNGRIIIEGHASATHTGPHNRMLSINRAANVRSILESQLGFEFMQNVDVQVREAFSITQEVELNNGLRERDQYLSPEQAAIQASERERDVFDCAPGSLACDVQNGYTMEVIAYGESAPAVANTTQVNLATNRRTDIQFETVKRIRTEVGGQIWATEDPLTIDPRLNVVATQPVRVVNGRAAEPVAFRVYSNYNAYIDRAEILVYRNTDEQLLDPVATIPVTALHFTTPIGWDANMPLEVGQDFAYVLKAYGSNGQVDKTAPRVLRVVGANAATDNTDQGKQIFGDNNLAQQNIQIHGSRVRVRGVALEPNSMLTINNEQVMIDAGGKFVYEQHLPIGEHSFSVVVSETEETKTGSELAVNVEGEKFFMVGIASLTIGQNSVSGDLEPLEGDERLTSDDVYTDGRIAFYAKGKIKGKYLITAQLDTTEDELSNIGDNLTRKNPQDIFRRLDPDRYYPVYGDDSTTTRDVNTQGAFYVKVEWDESMATWGNYNTGMTRNEFAQYSRSLYGAQMVYKATNTTKYGDNRVSVSAFAAEPLAEHGHNTFRATGGSLYYLRDTDIVRGSEKIWIEVRRRDTEQAADRMTLVEGRDYEIDYIQGRIILRRPLTQVVATRNPNIIQDRPLEGDDVFLHVDYEYVPQSFSDENLTAGVSAEAYLTDSVAIGGTYVTEQRAGTDPDYTLAGVDATIKLGEGSYIRAEFATSESNQVNNAQTPGQDSAGYFSSDGGLVFTDVKGVSQEQSGDAIAAEIYVSMQDFMQRNGYLKAWYKDRDAGFSGTSRLAEGTATTDIGAEASVQFTERFSIAVRANQLTTGEGANEDERLTGSLQADVDVTNRLSVGGELRYESTSLNGGDSIEALLGGARVDYDITDSTTIFGKAQGVIDSDDGYADNAQYGFGFNTRVNDRLALGLEAISGDRGDALNASIDWAVNDRTRMQLTAGVGDGATSSIGASYLSDSGYELYGSYSVDTDRTAGERSTMTIGQRKAFGNALKIFAEHQFTNGDREAGLAHTFGIDYMLTQQWLFTASLQTSDIETSNGSTGITNNVERNVVSLGASYQGERVKGSLKAEYREDKYSDGGDDVTQTLVSGTIDYQANPSLTILGRANVSVSDSDSSELGRFTEASVGFAYRPVGNDRFNLLGKYTFLYDQAAGANADSGQATNRRNDERANIFSLEGLYDVSERWELGAKVAYKQNSLRTGRGTGEWFDSSSYLGVIRARYHFVQSWDAVIEYRYLAVQEAEQDRSGILLAVYRHLGNNLKVGVGYNFTDFNDDLGNQSYDNQGWFIDIIGKF